MKKYDVIQLWAKTGNEFIPTPCVDSAEKLEKIMLHQYDKYSDPNKYRWIRVSVPIEDDRRIGETELFEFSRAISATEWKSISLNIRQYSTFAVIGCALAMHDVEHPK